MFQTIVMQIEWKYFPFNMEIQPEVVCLTALHVCINHYGKYSAAAIAGEKANILVFEIVVSQA
jgi:hypothetical protein